MQFNSYSFFIFILYVFAVHFSPASWRVKRLNLLFASYLFYAAWQVPYLLLIAISTLIDWCVAKALATQEDPRRRKWLLLVSLFANLGMLAVFKYADFALGSVASVLGAVGVDWEPPSTGLLLPVGISFYTFQTLSYSIDVYLRKMEPAKSFLDYSLYVAFFPQLVAGPIVRAETFLPQCNEPTKFNAKNIGFGVTLFVIGIWEKAVLADGIFAPVVEATYTNPNHLSLLEAWAGTLAFAGQILCDFAGYSSCALGISKCLGFDLPLNFQFPYAAIGFSDFWRRWHISLSSWLRDYLYIPLGGNRGGRLFTARNLMLTMLLGGLWHGASWNFVVWGALHGVYLAGERALRKIDAMAKFGASLVGKVVAWAITFVAVCVAWVFFRAATLEDSIAIVKTMFGGSEHVLGVFGSSMYDFVLHTYVLALVAIFGLIVFSLRQRRFTTEQVLVRQKWPVLGICIALMLMTIATMSGDNRAFIYFQF